MRNNSFIAIMFFLGIVTGLSAQDDRLSFDLCGDVRLCVPSVADNGFALPSLRAEFSERGTLVKLGGMDMTVDNGSYAVKRDTKNRIVRLDFSAGDADRVNVFSYDHKGKVIEVKDYFMNIDTDEEVLDSRMVREYNSDGFPVKETYYNEDGSVRAAYVYTYVGKDKSGNWLKRTVKETSQGLDDVEETREVSLNVPAASEEPTAAVGERKAVDASFDDSISSALDAKKRVGRSSKDWFWELLWGVLFAALFVHAIYVNYVKKPEFVRLPEGSEADTPEEEKLAERLHGVVNANVTSLQPLGVDDSVPVTRDQLKNIKAAMREVQSAEPHGCRVVDTYNAAVDMVEASEKRVFSGSKMYLVLGVVVVGVIAVMRIFEGHIIQGAAYFLFSFFAYWLGCKRQLYRVIGSELKRPAGPKSSAAAILAVFGFMASSRTYITKYYMNGIERPEQEGRDDSEHIAFGFMGFMALVFLGLLMPFVGLFNYLRFYVISR